MSDFLSKEAFLSQIDIDIEKVDLPKPYNGCVFVRSMSGVEWNEYQESITKTDSDGKRELDLDNIRVKLLVRSVCDEEGNLIFNSEDISAIAKKSNRVIEKLTKVAQRLNGIGAEAEEKK